jgi:hypothetical protein
MSDPRYTGSGYPDPRAPRDNDPIAPRRVYRDSGTGQMWTWVAAIVAVTVVIALVAGYYRHDTSTESRVNAPPSTTGAAPSAPIAPSAVPTIPAPARPPASTVPPAASGAPPAAPAPADHP